MSQKVNIDLVNIQGKQVENNVKNLKQKIKELKDELAETGLETDEAKAKLKELGDLMHTQAEITELARLESVDYGDTLASVTKATAGLVGGISAVNSVFTLMGVQSQEATKSLQSISAMMALVQSLSTFDTAEKSFQSLYNRLKKNIGALKEHTTAENVDTQAINTNTTATNNNNTALNKISKSLTTVKTGFNTLKNGVKSVASSLLDFAKANPFTLIITAISTAIGLIGVFREKAKQAALDAEKATTESMKQMYATIMNYDDIQIEDKWVTEKMGRMKRAVDSYKKVVDEAIQKGEMLNTQMGQREDGIDVNTLKQAKEEYEDLKDAVMVLEQEYSFLNKTERESSEGLELRKKIMKAYIEMYDAELEFNEQNIVLLTNRLLTLEKGSDIYNEVLEKINFLKDNLDSTYTEELNSYNELVKIDENEKNKQKERNEKYYQEKYNEVKEWLDLEQKKLELSYKKKEIDEEDYLDKSLKINETYLEKLEGLKKKHNPNVTESEILGATTNIEASKLAKAEYDIKKIRDRQIKEVDNLVLDEINKLNGDIEVYKQTILENNAKIKALQGKNLHEQYELLKNADNATKEEKIAHINDMLAIEIDYLEEQNKLNEINYNNQRQYQIDTYNREKEALEKELELIKNENDRIAQNEKILQLEEEHEKQLLILKQEYTVATYDIELQKTQITAEASNERVEIERAEIERRIELQNKYVDVFSNVYGQITNLMSAIQSGYDANSEEYKNIQKGMIVADTITGAMSAYKSGVQSGLPAPWNLIYGGTLAGLVTATGIKSLQNLENESIDTTSSVNNINTNPYETISYSTLSNIEGNILDSKVYVVESEIQATGRRVRTTENEAMF